MNHQKQKKTYTQGFTLIELMIVVVILGVLSSIAIPAFVRFIRKSKTSEAPIAVHAIVDGAITWYESNHAQANTGDPQRKHFPHDGNDSQVRIGPKTLRRPLKKPCDTGSNPMYKKNAAQWEKNPWTRLKFSLNKAHYFQYHYTYHNPKKGAASFTVEANSDLDCDLELSSYKQFGKVNTATGEVERSQFITTDALE